MMVGHKLIVLFVPLIFAVGLSKKARAETTHIQEYVHQLLYKVRLSRLQHRQGVKKSGSNHMNEHNWRLHVLKRQKGVLTNR